MGHRVYSIPSYEEHLLNNDDDDDDDNNNNNNKCSSVFKHSAEDGASVELFLVVLKALSSSEGIHSDCAGLSKSSPVVDKQFE